MAINHLSLPFSVYSSSGLTPPPLFDMSAIICLHAASHCNSFLKEDPRPPPLCSDAERKRARNDPEPSEPDGERAKHQLSERASHLAGVSGHRAQRQHHWCVQAHVSSICHCKYMPLAVFIVNKMEPNWNNHNHLQYRLSRPLCPPGRFTSPSNSK